MPGPRPRPVDLSADERDILTAITRRYSAPHALVQRAEILLLADQGLTKTAIARQMGVSTNMPDKWRRRWFESLPVRRALQEDPSSGDPASGDPASGEPPSGEPGALAHFIEHEVLADKPRSGAPPTFTPEMITQIIALALQDPEEVGRPITHWTPAELADEAVRQGIVASISPRTVGRFLKRGRPQASSQPLLDASAAG